MTLATRIAEKANALQFENFPADAVDWAKVAITDAVGCALAGVAEDAAKIALGVSRAANPGGGQCTVLGTPEHLSSFDAAFVNGVTAHALDFDDTSKSMAGHPTVVILPAILALGEELGVSGREILAAYVTGLETATRIARGINFRHYEKGWHPTATIGIFGATAACGRLLKLDTARMSRALGIAVSLSSGVKSNFGSQTKPLHAGAASRNGLLAARLAEQNFTASPDAFEHPQGFLTVFNGDGEFDTDRILADWGQPLDLLNPGISIKKYPCVYSIHAAIDCAISLRTEHLFSGENIKQVVVTMHKRRLLPHVQRPADSVLNAKFSLAYGIARGLVDGRVSMEHFEGLAYQDPAVHAVMDRIITQTHDDDTRDYAASVLVELNDGRSFTRTIEVPLGSGPKSPLPEAMLKAKFEDCACRVLTSAQADRLYALLRRLESVPDIRSVTASTKPG